MSRGSAQTTDDDVAESLDADDDPPKPVGAPVGRKDGSNLYAAFEYKGTTYKLEDTVFAAAEHPNEKPYIGIVKKIVEDHDGELTLHGRWFYRPEEVLKFGVQLCDWDNREIYYSFHDDTFPAGSVMHKCVIHFISPGDRLPDRFKQPGMFVRKIFDTVSKTLLELTCKGLGDDEQCMVDLLIKKSKECLSAQLLKPETSTVFPPRFNAQGCKPNAEKHIRKMGAPLNEDECEIALTRRKVLSGDKMRDVGLKKLLEGVSCACIIRDKNPGKVSADTNKYSEINDGTQHARTSNMDVGSFCMDDAVHAVSTLEKLVYKSFPAPSKYNQKMRQLLFNFKQNELLVQRFLNKELGADVILNMSPEELKDGQVTQEKPEKPDRPEHMRMTDIRCSKCSQQNVGISDIIRGGLKERYLMECLSCGNTWYSSPGGHY